VGWTETEGWNDLGSTSKGQRVAVAAFGARCLRPRRRGVAQKWLVFTLRTPRRDINEHCTMNGGCVPLECASDEAAPREVSARGGLGSRPGVAVWAATGMRAEGTGREVVPSSELVLQSHGVSWWCVPFLAHGNVEWSQIEPVTNFEYIDINRLCRTEMS